MEKRESIARAFGIVVEKKGIFSRKGRQILSE